MIQFTHPAFLWTLAGLSIPLAIHLLSRKEGKILRLGSLRHIQETSTQQFKGIRLNEILLLTLRCLLIFLLTLFLSGLSWTHSGGSRWLLIEKGLEKQPRLRLLLDSLNEQGYESHLLAESFPLLKDSAAASPVANYRRLLGQLKVKNISEIIVFAKNKADNFKGLRESLPGNVRWISQPQEPLDYSLVAIQTSADSAILRKGHTDAASTYFISKKIAKSNSPESVPASSVSIQLVSDNKYAFDKAIIKASLKAIEKYTPVTLALTEATPSNALITTDWCFWLSDEKLPATESKIFYLKPQPSNDLFIQVNKGVWKISKRLDEEVALKENMTLQLASILVPEKAMWKIADENDRRMLPDSIAWTTAGINPTIAKGEITPESADHYLFALFFILLLVERNIAYKRNQ